LVIVGALLTLAAYEQPVSLLLAVPLYVVLHAAGYRVGRAGAAIVAAPVGVLVVALLVNDRIEASHHAIFPRIDPLSYPVSLRVGAVLGYQRIVQFDGPMTWFAAGFDG